MNTYKGEAKITISRYSNTRPEDNPVHIVIEDGISGVRILDLSMHLEDFASALLGLGYIKSNMELYIGAIRDVGMKRIHKTISVKVNKEQKESYYKCKNNDRANVIRKILEPYDIDGWTGSTLHLFNHHYGSGNDTYNVSFTKFVTPEEAEEYNKPKEQSNE